LVRVGERRWDVVLDRGQRILLPPDDPVRTLERVIVLNEARSMLDRDVAVVDMRLAQRPTLQMSQAAVEEWWRIRKMNGADTR
jgi:cell division protein FtsQ